MLNNDPRLMPPDRMAAIRAGLGRVAPRPNERSTAFEPSRLLGGAKRGAAAALACLFFLVNNKRPLKEWDNRPSVPAAGKLNFLRKYKALTEGGVGRGRQKSSGRITAARVVTVLKSAGQY